MIIFTVFLIYTCTNFVVSVLFLIEQWKAKYLSVALSQVHTTSKYLLFRAL